MIILRDIAEATGLSVHTVSDILNAHDERYSKASIRKVRLASRNMGYQPSRLAQTMRTGRSRSIGLISRSGLLQASLERVTETARLLKERDYSVLHADLPLTADSINDACHMLLDARVEGVVMAMMTPEFGLKQADAFKKRGIPLVFLSGPEIPGFPLIRCDVCQGVRDLTGHLLGLGYRHIGYAASRVDDNPADRACWTTRERLNGFRETILSAGGEVRWANESSRNKGSACLGELFPCCEDVFNDPYAQGRRVMREILDRSNRPRALMFRNDNWAVGALEVCRRAGVRVPEDIALAGFDNASLCHTVTPTLTSVAQPIREMAERAVNLLFELIADGSKQHAGLPEVIPCDLIVRESCGSRHGMTDDFLKEDESCKKGGVLCSIRE